MRINSADIMFMGGKAFLALEAPHEAIKEFLAHNEGKYPFDVEIKRKRKKRSLNANSYAWVLCDKIASAIGITKEEVYRSHIHDVGVFTDIWIRLDASNDFIEEWESSGIGRIAEPIFVNGNYVNIRTYYGSSTYDTKQMSRLIDNIVHEAKGLGIETMTPDELERLKQTWNVQ